MAAPVPQLASAVQFRVLCTRLNMSLCRRMAASPLQVALDTVTCRAGASGYTYPTWQAGRGKWPNATALLRLCCGWPAPATLDIPRRRSHAEAAAAIPDGLLTPQIGFLCTVQSVALPDSVSWPVSCCLCLACGMATRPRMSVSSPCYRCLSSGVPLEA